MPDFDKYSGDNVQPAFDVKTLFKLVNDMTESCKAKLTKLKGSGSGISIGEMFEMQLLMNKLSQMSELATGTSAALHSAIISITRNLK